MAEHERGRMFSFEVTELEALRKLLSAAKAWRHETERRLRLLDSRGEVRPLPSDQHLFDAIADADKARPDTPPKPQ